MVAQQGDDDVFVVRMANQLLESVGLLYVMAKNYSATVTATPLANIPHDDDLLKENIKSLEDFVGFHVMNDFRFAEQLVEDVFLQNTFRMLMDQDEATKSVQFAYDFEELPQPTKTAALKLVRAFDTRCYHLMDVLEIASLTYEHIPDEQNRH